MKVLISDIAKKAGVSSGTVSNAINNRKGISEEKRREILAVANEMGYFSQKDSLKKDIYKIKFLILNKKGNVVGDTPFFSELIRGIEMECSRLNYELVISHLSVDEKDDILKAIRPDLSDGILILGTEIGEQDLKVFKLINTPIVILDTMFKSQEFDFVAINNIDSSYEIVEKIINAGHKNIGIINSLFLINNFSERCVGFVNAMKDNGLDQEEVFLVEPTLEGSFKSMKVYLKKMLENSEPIPTAFFAVNDNIAIGAMKAFKEIVPKMDISIVGFDDIPLSEFCDPPLTTIKVDKVYLGQQSVRRLIDKIILEDKNHIKQTICTSIIERESIKKITT